MRPKFPIDISCSQTIWDRALGIGWMRQWYWNRVLAIFFDHMKDVGDEEDYFEQIRAYGIKRVPDQALGNVRVFIATCAPRLNDRLIRIITEEDGGEDELCKCVAECGIDFGRGYSPPHKVSGADYRSNARDRLVYQFNNEGQVNALSNRSQWNTTKPTHIKYGR